MPIDLEMLLSASNQEYFPYSAFDTTSAYEHRLSFPESHCIPRSPSKHQNLFLKKTENGGFSRGTSYNRKNEAAASQGLYGTRKKKVSFADDKGFELVEVREIPGVPKWAEDVLTLLLGHTKRTVVKEKKWKPAFEHPPWPDSKLIDMLEKNMVALEHISVKEGPDDFLVGTVKVKNLAFQKNIFLRVTFDRWLSYVDIPCTYMKPYKARTRPSTYDTFNFSAKILSVASRYEVIEFCVCFQCDGKEYWDNNWGINYRFIVEHVRSSVPDLHQTCMTAPCNNEGYSDSSGNNEELFTYDKLMHENPYW